MRRWLGIAALIVLAGCPIPEPRPTILDGGPGDLFSGKIFNCRLEVVAVERDSAMVDVKRCLLGLDTQNPSPPLCLVAQVAQYKADTVACVARDLGASANAAAVSGMANEDEKALALVVRTWILERGMGYR